VGKKFSGTDQIRYTGNFDHGVEIDEFKYYTKGYSKHPFPIKTFSENGTVAGIVWLKRNNIRPFYNTYISCTFAVLF